MSALAKTPCCTSCGCQSPRSCGSTTAGGSGGSSTPSAPSSPELGPCACPRPLALKDLPSDADELFHRMCTRESVSRKVQMILGKGQTQDALEVLQCMRGRVPEAMESGFGNYAVSSLIDNCANDEEIVALILEELMEHRLYWAKHEYGVRTICKLLKMSVRGTAVTEFLDGILEAPWDLVFERFGHQVLDYALRHGMAHQKSWIIQALFADGASFQWWARWSPNACFLLEAAVEGVAEEQAQDPAALQQERQLIIQAIASCTVEAFLWICGQHGSTPVDKAFIMLKAAAALPEIEFYMRLPSSEAALRSCRHGKRFLKSLGARATA